MKFGALGKLIVGHLIAGVMPQEETTINIFTLDVSRSSVCMGDDVDAPHRKIFKGFQGENLEQLAWFLSENYLLAGVAGGNAAWLMIVDEAVAVFGQSWDEPKVLSHRDQRIKGYADVSGVITIKFIYYSELTPEELYTLKAEAKQSNQGDPFDSAVLV